MIRKIVNKFLRNQRTSSRGEEFIGLDEGLTTLEEDIAKRSSAGGSGGPGSPSRAVKRDDSICPTFFYEDDVRRYAREEAKAFIEALRSSDPDSPEDWESSMRQRREEMKRFMRIGAVAASDERAELLRALRHARRAIDACAPYAETIEAMAAPEFRDEINRLMVCFAEMVKRRPDSHESVWDVVGGSQPYLRANSSQDHEGV